MHSTPQMIVLRNSLAPFGFDVVINLYQQADRLIKLSANASECLEAKPRRTLEIYSSHIAKMQTRIASSNLVLDRGPQI